MLNGMLTVMIIIALSLNNLSNGSLRIRNKIARRRSDNLNYKLTENVFPEHYTLKISPHFNNSTFIGYVKILIHVKKPTDNITLHQKYLNITEKKIYLTTENNLVINIKDAGDTGTKEQEFYTITFSKLLLENTYYLHIPEFYGNLYETNWGFHYAHYTDKNGTVCKFATTNFEPTTARCAFPCFDEPSFRAKFKIYIIRPSNYHSISNAKLIKSIELNNTLYEDEFEDTVSMSTYVVAFVVSKLKLLTSRDNNFYRVLARPEMLEKRYEENSLKLSIKIMQALETYLNVTYTLDKMDQAVIPDEFFSHDGMENWGLVIYKESSFLITPQIKTKKQFEIALIITHAFAHQWFGNLVAIKWWRYLWLKEGFAQFLQSRILDIIKPEWKVMEQYIAMKKHNILEQDSSNMNRHMNEDAGKPSEISRLYDHISYEKASCIIHMLEAIMTPNIFRRGLTNYLQDRAFKSAIPSDLYRNLQKSLDNSEIKLPQNLNIDKIMTIWDSQIGYPLVYVQRNYNKNQEVVKLTQSRYVFSEDATLKSATWYIPINYASRSNPNFNDTGFSNWLQKSNETITISNLKRDDWLILNKQEAYYYRVNYDVKNWKLIAKVLEENYRNIHILNRAQIIDDSFNLAKRKEIDFSIPLEISNYLYQEDDYIMHSVFLRYIPYIRTFIRGTNVEQKFQDYVINSLKRSYQRLGNNPRGTDTHVDKLHRKEVVRWMCEFDYSQCRAKTWKSFDRWRTNNKSLDVDLENEIFCNAIRYGNEDDWNYLNDMYESSSNDEFRSMLLESLMCSENVSTLLHFIESVQNLQNETKFKNVLNVISCQGLVGLNVSKHYVAEHFNDLLSKFHDDYMQQLLNSIISHFTTNAQLDEFIELLPQNRNTTFFRLEVLLNYARDDISLKQKSKRQISKFFQSYKPPNDSKQIRSDGNLHQAIPHLFSFILYSLIIFVASI